MGRGGSRRFRVERSHLLGASIARASSALDGCRSSADRCRIAARHDAPNRAVYRMCNGGSMRGYRRNDTHEIRRTPHIAADSPSGVFGRGRFLRCAARFRFGFGGGCSATQLRRRSHQTRHPGGANGPPMIRSSSSRGSTGWGCLRLPRVCAPEMSFIGLYGGTSVIFGRTRCFEALRGGGEHHRQGRRRADRRRLGCERARRTSPSGRTG
jgi:hypothetical protein